MDHFKIGIQFFGTLFIWSDLGWEQWRLSMYPPHDEIVGMSCCCFEGLQGLCSTLIQPGNRKWTLGWRVEALNKQKTCGKGPFCCWRMYAACLFTSNGYFHTYIHMKHKTSSVPVPMLHGETRSAAAAVTNYQTELHIANKFGEVIWPCNAIA